MSNMSLHCICLVLPLTRTLELLHVRCIACITSSVAKPMAKKNPTNNFILTAVVRKIIGMNYSIHQWYLCVFSCWVRNQECRIALAPPSGQLCRPASELRCCSCRSSAAARPCKPQTQGDIEGELCQSFHEVSSFFSGVWTALWVSVNLLKRLCKTGVASLEA